MPRYPLTIDLSGPSLNADERALLRDYRVSGVCLFSRNFRDHYQAADLTAELRELQGAALLVATDQEGGGVVRARDMPFSPGTMLLGAADDPGPDPPRGRRHRAGLTQPGRERQLRARRRRE